MAQMTGSGASGGANKCEMISNGSTLISVTNSEQSMLIQEFLYVAVRMFKFQLMVFVARIV